MSEVKVNKVSPRSGTGLQLGDSGDTITIPAGATITNSGTAVNFGATGSASWVTTVKTGDFTAVAGEGYFVNTTSGEIDVTLPASPSAGAVVAIKDYANTWDTNNCILLRNGSNIGGQALNSILSTEGLAVTLVYVDATKGWLVTDSGLQSEAPGPEYVAASGGNTTLTVCSHKVHIFTGPGTLCVSAAGNAAGSNAVEYLVVAGSAGGTTDWAGGSGAGGWRSYSALPSAHPLNSPAALPVSVQGYPIEVGGAGTVGTGPSSCSPNGLGTNGSNSIFSTITSAGGGRSGNEGVTGQGAPGGSGGGAGTGGGPGDGSGGTGNTPPTNPAQGSDGGNNASNTTGYTAGGGGAGGTGEGCGSGSVPGGAGGVGAYVVDGFIGPTAPSYGTPGPVGSTRYFSGGGGGAGGSSPRTGGAGGAGGGGAGGVGPAKGTAGTVNTGGGGGGGSGNESPNPGSSGGSGIVMIRYKFQA